MMKCAPAWQDNLEDTKNPSVSVVVCTKDRPEKVSECVESILNLTYDSFEVVIVDNSAYPQVEGIGSASNLVRYVWEGKPGSGFARAAGVRHARGEIIAMTDDDCQVDPLWLRWLTAGFRDKEVMCCTGRVVAAELITPAQVILETYCSYSKGDAPNTFGSAADHRTYLTPHEVGTGANMAFRRSVFGLVGSFDGALGAGTPAAGGEELDMFSRVLRTGAKVTYEPRALVKHTHPREYAQLKRTFIKYGIGYNAFMTKLILTVREPGPFRAAVGRTLFWYRWTKQSVKYRLCGLPHMPLDLQSAYLLGSLYGPFGYLRSVRKARRLLAAGDRAVPSVDLAGEWGGEGQ